MEEEQPATGAHGYFAIPSDDQSEFVVVQGWGRGLRRVASQYADAYAP